MKKKNSIAKDLRTPKYRPRVVQNKKRKLKAKAERRELKQQLPSFFMVKDRHISSLITEF